MWAALTRQSAMASDWRTRRVRTDSGVGNSIVVFSLWCATCTSVFQYYALVPFPQLPWRSTRMGISVGELFRDKPTNSLPRPYFLSFCNSAASA